MKENKYKTKGTNDLFTSYRHNPVQPQQWSNKKREKLCTAHTKVCPECQKDKIVEPLVMIKQVKLTDCRQCRGMPTKQNRVSFKLEKIMHIVGCAAHNRAKEET